ncbi:nucleoside monophosphate kinase [Oscillatoriales cyanobacterium LEGE 11467]|uniref:Adenylate kinase n=1 Tax=Zarconia navalis LEGE 11467 TaxID=1828826 RepID=A0A928Z754_9CYAN|nr:nucleoside monophosphate kinase [Zarconia navalis]MBE9039323.1 nucleoside monophosphate kinase [Zarconia navalis LEGE 11467]
MKLVILGGPGAGKGTQGKQLCSHLNIPWISTGEIFRGAIAAQTNLGLQSAPFVEKGELVPDTIAIELIRERLTQPDAQSGWLLDGYPRTAFQAEELDFLLDDLGQRLDWAIWIDVPVSVLMSRSLERSRADDRPEIVRRRIDLFHQRTIPITEYYEPRQRLLRIDGDRPPESIARGLLETLGC